MITHCIIILEILVKVWVFTKPLKRVLRKKNINLNDYVHCCVIDCHGNSLLHLV